MKKPLLISFVIMLFFSFKSVSQRHKNVVLSETGSLVSLDTAAKIVTNHAPLRSVSKGDSIGQFLDFNTADFKVVNGQLTSNYKPPIKVLIPKNDLRQMQRATGNQRVFIFRNVPPNEEDFLLIKNGTVRPPNEYKIEGNNITVPSALNKDVFELVMLIREKYW